ncbi:hypothetical protein AKJ09_01540 [Labilithrix luteola]|uniref:Lipoprotein n=1 Tax=Labilithrix luteola TaxID=1391654 RepID=A0A0K1PNA7_9BACT|nr:hypothetical protein [Labilithrix luteola]AKU94876.1 hypothetical protein AKJ09_01540 [Labilithrix luteola]
MEQSRLARLGSLNWAALLALAACSSSEPSSNVGTSTVQGKLTVASFPTAPTAVDAIDEAGNRAHSPVGTDGAFALQLAKGHSYRLVVVSAKEVPFVFPRSTRLDTSFRVSTGGGVVSLGSVRHWDSLPSGGFKVLSASTSSSSPDGQEGQDGECVDGKLQGTDTPCADDDNQTECKDGSQAVSSDGECENGKDAVTGQACTDTDTAGDDAADPAQPMAVPDKNAPDDVSGCNENDGEEADD